MNKIGKLTFGTQIVPIKSEKPMTPKEKEELTQVKNVLDQNIGKDVINFKIKDEKNIDVIVNHPDPKVEQAIADRMREMTTPPASKTPAAAPKAQPTGKNVNIVA